MESNIIVKCAGKVYLTDEVLACLVTECEAMKPKKVGS